MITLDATTKDALLRAVDDGAVDFDGLHVERRDDGYALSTPSTGDRRGLSEDALGEALETIPAHVTNWRYWEHVGGRGTARRAYLRWLERADTLDVPDRYARMRSGEGIVRTWGQLRITTTAEADGRRRHELRHVDDAGEAADALETLDDPHTIRELVSFDARGRYRPLKTAPTLVSGWVFPALGGRALVDAVDRFYPATIANWHREAAGELDVTHWLDAAERQTGIYDVVDELPRDAVEWMAEACCVDSQCLKRREWDYDADDALAVDRGDGQFPCREPCSLVIAAARTWTIAESEEPRRWELELTLGEKRQLEALIDAVADGRIEEIREADLADGANRYRARYLRAKRFDEDGHLEARPLDDSDEEREDG